MLHRSGAESAGLVDGGSDVGFRENGLDVKHHEVVFVDVFGVPAAAGAGGAGACQGHALDQVAVTAYQALGSRTDPCAAYVGMEAENESVGM